MLRDLESLGHMSNYEPKRRWEKRPLAEAAERRVEFPFTIQSSIRAQENDDLVLGVLRDTSVGEGENTWRRLRPDFGEVWRLNAELDPVAATRLDSGDLLLCECSIQSLKGFLRRVDAATGIEQARRELSNVVYGFWPPVETERGILTSSFRYLYCLDRKTLSTRWRGAITTVDNAPSVCPGLDQCIVPSQRGELLGVSLLNGKTAWSMKLESRNPIPFTLLDRQFVCTLSGPLLEIDPAKGAEISRRPLSGFLPPLQLGAEFILVDGDDVEGYTVRRLGTAVEDQAWCAHLPCAGDGTSIFTPQKIVLLDNVLWVATLQDSLFALNADSGGVLLEVTQDGSRSCSNGYCFAWQNRVWTQHQGVLHALPTHPN